MKVQVTVVCDESPNALAARAQPLLDQHWRPSGGIAYGDGLWAVLLVKEEKKEELQYPYKPERTMAYQEVAKHVALQR